VTPDEQHAVLAAELTALGRRARMPAVPDDLAATVLTRVSALSSPGRSDRWRRYGVADLARRRWRAVTAAVVALLVGLLAAPPVRAAVADWFGFGGVQVHRGSAPRASTTAAPPPAAAGGELAEARRLVSFEPLVPAELGRPDGVEVSADRRVVSMTWSGAAAGAVRLDQFEGRIDYAVAKTSPDVRFTNVGADDALWFPGPHDVAFLAPDGSRRIETARLAGQTLVWQHGGLTLRLEGDLDLRRAQRIAATALP
jgi:hypothetical protein